MPSAMDQKIVHLIIGVFASILGAVILYYIKKFKYKKIEIPIYTIPLLIGLTITFTIVVKDSLLPDPYSKNYKTVQGKIFNTETIVMDGKSFVRCDFVNSKLVFEGSKGFQLKGCNFRGNNYQIQGNLMIAINILNSMYNSPMFKEVVEDYILKMIQSPHRPRHQERINIDKPPTYVE